MKSRLLPFVPLTLALASCAPQAKVVREIPANAGSADDMVEAPALPVDTGPALLEPPSLLGLPSERDMEATADPEPSSSPVIATPSRDE